MDASAAADRDEERRQADGADSDEERRVEPVVFSLPRVAGF